ncbi:MAG: DUF1109 family protein [Acidobacteria bacterium]|nr:DUF1109 family protein [Acidobacteriota bacterium]
MNCSALDNLLDHSVPPSAWPPAAREHLNSCPRCRSLEETLSRFLSTATPNPPYAAITQQLVAGLVPVRPLLPMPARALGFFLCAAGTGALLASITGNRGWIALDPPRRAVIFLAAMIAAAVQATLFAMEMEPGRGFAPAVRHARWLTPAVFAAASVILFPWAPDADFLSHWALCLGRAGGTALVALGAIYLAARRGYFVDFRRAGAAVGLLAGLGAFVSQELYCPILEAAHVAASHVGLLLVLSLAGPLLGAAANHHSQAIPTAGSNA